MINQVVFFSATPADYEKEKSVHDLLIENVVYDTVAFQNLNKYHSRSNSILGVLFYKTAVCEGIAKVTKMLLNLLDIKCIVAMGTAGGELHSWNIVKIDNEAYQLDVTWDINLSSKDNFRYDYFNLTDQEMLIDHNPSIKYPACKSNQSNYFYKSKLVAKNLPDIEKIIAASRLKRKKFITFKYVGDNFEKTVKSAVSIASSMKVFSVIKSVSYSVNNDQKICTIKV
jgi:transglutaminase/protease-like cytokinesis protein 3